MGPEPGWLAGRGSPTTTGMMLQDLVGRVLFFGGGVGTVFFGLLQKKLSCYPVERVTSSKVNYVDMESWVRVSIWSTHLLDIHWFYLQKKKKIFQ